MLLKARVMEEAACILAIGKPCGGRQRLERSARGTLKGEVERKSAIKDRQLYRLAAVKQNAIASKLQHRTEGARWSFS